MRELSRPAGLGTECCDHDSPLQVDKKEKAVLSLPIDEHELAEAQETDVLELFDPGPVVDVHFALNAPASPAVRRRASAAHTSARRDERQREGIIETCFHG
ncbi:MAG TPA: hypothetical protein VID29_07990 [Solirubrobacteraceae bacterium]